MTGVFEGVGTLQFSPDNKFSYIYSGFIAAVNTSVTYLNFTTGGYYLVGQFQFNTPLEQADPTAGIEATCRVDFNNVGIAMLKASSDFNDNSNGSVTQELIIPPFTNVIVVVDAHATDPIRFGTCSFISKVKGAIEQENLESITDSNKWASK